MSVLANGNAHTSGPPSDEDRDVAQVLDLAGELPAPSAWPTLVVLVGPPGAGKSTLAASLRDRLPVAVIDADRVRHALVGSPDYSFGESYRLSRAIRSAIRQLLEQRITVVFDDCNLTEWERQPLYTLTDATGARLVIIQVTAPIQVLLSRVQHNAESEDRDTQHATQYYYRMAGRQEPITHAHHAVDTSDGVQAVVDDLVRQIEEIEEG